MAVVAILGLMGMCNAGVLSTSRFPFAMARASLMPPWLGRLHPTRGTPIAAIALTGLVLLVLVLGLPDSAGEIVLLSPDQNVPEGGRMH
jgi:amino acid transporter